MISNSAIVGAFFSNYKKKIFYGVLFLFSLMAISLQIVYKKSLGVREYTEAHRIFSKWQASKGDKELSALLQYMQRPSLSYKYRSSLMQDLILTKPDFALPLVDQIVKENSSLLPTYYLFTEATKYIVQEDYAKALDISLSLKSQAKVDSYLYAYNIIRIMHLCHLMGNEILKQETKEELQAFLSQHPKYTNLNQDNIHFTDYIAINECCASLPYEND